MSRNIRDFWNIRVETFFGRKLLFRDAAVSLQQGKETSKNHSILFIQEHSGSFPALHLEDGFKITHLIYHTINHSVINLK